MAAGRREAVPHNILASFDISLTVTPDTDPRGSMAGSSSESQAFLETLEGEISFFRSIMRARPIGMHRQFHVLAMRTAIHKDTGHWVSVEDIWEKLRGCYDIDALDAIVIKKFINTGKGWPRPGIICVIHDSEEEHYTRRYAVKGRLFKG